MLHRNLPGLLTIVESLDLLGVVDPLLFRSIEQFVGTQLPNVAFVNNHQNMDLVIALTNIFHKHLGDISPEFQKELGNCISKYLKSAVSEQGEDLSFKCVEKVARLQSKVFKNDDQAQ